MGNHDAGRAIARKPQPMTDWIPDTGGGFMSRCPTCREAICSPLNEPLPPDFQALNERLGLEPATCAWC